MRSDSPVELHEVGAYHLKGISLPERVFSLGTDPVGSSNQSAGSLTVTAPRVLPTNNLPVQPTSFVGREREQREVIELISESRLVTLVGTGGAGKTRLGLQTASELLDGTGDGVWLIELAPIADPVLVDSTVLKVLGLKENPETSSLETLLNALRSRRLLIFLDNCEHLIDACAKLADALLRGCRDVHLLATSREPLGVPGESIYRVPSLSVPSDKPISPETALQFGAVALFIDRAHSHDRSFRFDDETTPAVVSICRQVDGIPLAIELAAARLRTMPIHSVNERLSDRLRLLTGGSRTNLHRQQTLRVLIDWSYDLLSEAERTVLRRLSVFVGGFEVDLAEKICARDDLDVYDVVDLIASLVDKSLVQHDLDGSIRYRLLETVRQYAAEYLSRETDDVRATQDAHADAYLALAEAAALRLKGPEQFDWLARLDAEVQNLRAAIAHFRADDNQAVKALRLTTALYRYWLIRGADRESKEIHGLALDHPSVQSPSFLRASALAQWGGSDSTAAARNDEAVALARTLNHPDLPLALCTRVFLLEAKGHLHEAMAAADEAVRFARTPGREQHLAVSLKCRANVHKPGKQPERELADLTESMRCSVTSGDIIASMFILNDLAYFEMEMNSLDDAERHARESYRLATEQSLNHLLPYPSTTLATLSLLRFRPADAQPFALEALEVSRVSGDPIGGAAILLLALSASGSGSFERAARLHGAADACSQELTLDFTEARLREQDHGRLREHLGDERFNLLYGEGTAYSSLDAVSKLLRES